MGEYSGSRAELPKNIRQIGERDEVVRLYVEDYVNTYLKQVYPSGGPGLRVGLLLGNSDPQQEVPCLFVDGALEMEEVVCGCICIAKLAHFVAADGACMAAFRRYSVFSASTG